MALDNGLFAGLLGARGFTFHEHLDQYGLINMNGRLYDPVLARFLQPDPVIQDPLNLQSYNAYAYVFNNPLKYIDPSGEIAWFVPILIGAGLAIASNVIQQGIASNWTFKNFNWGSLLADALVGAVLGAVSGGMANANVLAAASGNAISLGTKVTQVLAMGFLNAALGTWAKGISGQDVTLSDFGISFASGLVSGLAGVGLGEVKSTGLIGNIARGLNNSLGGQMAFGGLMGGGTSALLGGDFWEGFATGAVLAGMGKLANDLATRAEARAQANQQRINDYELWKNGAAERQKQREFAGATAGGGDDFFDNMTLSVGAADIYLGSYETFNKYLGKRDLAKFSKFAGKALGVYGVVEHGYSAYSDFSKGNYGKGTYHVLMLGLNVGGMVLKTNPAIMLGIGLADTMYGIYNAGK
ncbi:MAG: RHS repeat-associated core domain-containing protein [Bacteroidetes bacterium]|nr:MAG: RHS repeat-associated core domain-containing protein [Bacteroidota bacterium]